ncbi:Sugar transporter STL1 [Talaromyces islandicus]|uniref:Sugar transporter STL1 n=1 Tax=Talaromyces islandicus TaxID=28573 RepID=A0A0U1LYQ4_TALIS|nr:Sugar transporter STL1 [Talaromyces islandicus]
MRLWKHDFRGKALIAATTAASCQAFLLLGYDQGVMANIIGADNRFGKDFGHPDAAMQGNITALYDIGIMILGTIILASSYTVAQLIAGRIITGIGNGMNSSTAPVYQSECAPALNRGALLTLQGTVTILGVVIAYWTGYGTSFYESSFQWRFPLGFQAVFAIFLVLQTIGLPETPRWLVAHDRFEEASDVVSSLLDKPSDHGDVNFIIQDIRAGLEEENRDGPFQFKELFSWGKIQNFRRLLITISIEMGQQFTGSNMINYYAPVMFQENMHMSRNLSLLLGGATQCTYLVGSVIPVFLMDRFGRRTLLLVCSAGLCLCFTMVSILLSRGTLPTAYGATAFIFVFQLIYGIGWLPVAWFYPSEINTTRTRARMQAVASGWNWMFVFVVVKITPIAFANIGWKTFVIFAVLNAAFLPMVYCFYPETKGVELEDIPLLFVKGGITGGVLSSRGRTVTPHQHAEEALYDKGIKNEVENVTEQA